MARIVNTDNLGRDYPNEQFVLFPMRRQDAEEIVELINKAAGPHASRYYKVVDNDYVLDRSTPE